MKARPQTNPRPLPAPASRRASGRQFTPPQPQIVTGRSAGRSRHELPAE
ncbi:MAG: hypothetical protein HS108_06030 [Planctomycetes bacterium]|jgi:hypothetical protein|nr:hypothetical protein [Planctomycetota bacterium]MCL4729581.1 hypothetical protein [Planctomycetota bacterium]